MKLENFLTPPHFTITMAEIVRTLPMGFSESGPASRLASRVEGLLRSTHKIERPYVLVTTDDKDRPNLTIRIAPTSDLSQIAREIQAIIERT